MKQKLIIVHGAKALSSNNKIVQGIISIIYKYFFNFVPNYNIDNRWEISLKKIIIETIVFKWSGNIMPYDVPKATEKLIQIMRRYPKTEFLFLTESIGTEIVLSAIEKNKSKNIRGLIALCPVNKPRYICGFSMICLKSKYDTFSRFSNSFLWPKQIFKQSSGNIKFFDLENIRHDEFTPNHKICFKGQKKSLLSLIKPYIIKLLTKSKLRFA